ncbi:hypothetical protein ACFLZ7_01215 [Nanoarchaeota archaeon]
MKTPKKSTILATAALMSTSPVILPNVNAQQQAQAGQAQTASTQASTSTAQTTVAYNPGEGFKYKYSRKATLADLTNGSMGGNKREILNDGLLTLGFAGTGALMFYLGDKNPESKERLTYGGIAFSGAALKSTYDFFKGVIRREPSHPLTQDERTLLTKRLDERNNEIDDYNKEAKRRNIIQQQAHDQRKAEAGARLANVKWKKYAVIGGTGLAIGTGMLVYANNDPKLPERRKENVQIAAAIPLSAFIGCLYQGGSKVLEYKFGK